MTPLQLLLVRLPPLRNQCSQVLACQPSSSVAQIEEEHVVDLIDHMVGSELVADRLQMCPHHSKRLNEQELRCLPQADELAYPPQRPAGEPRPKPAVLSRPAGESDDHGFGLRLTSPKLRDRIKIICVQS